MVVNFMLSPKHCPILLFSNNKNPHIEIHHTKRLSLFTQGIKSTQQKPNKNPNLLRLFYFIK